MARGFWKGLLHGAVISVAGLVGLSLLTPVPDEAAEDETTVPEIVVPDLPADGPSVTPDETDEQQPDRAQDKAEAVISAPDESSQDDVSAAVPEEPTDSTAALQGPQAATVDLPVGSEFGRGGDVAPQIPAPMVSDMQSRQTDPPAVSAPAAEPAPIAITDPGVQPAADLPDTSLSGTQEPKTEEAAKPDVPVVLEISPTMETPEMIDWAAPDEAPAIAPANAGEEAGAGQQMSPEDISITPVGADRQNDADNPPELPNPGLDLSTPPDLSDLRVLEE